MRSIDRIKDLKSIIFASCLAFLSCQSTAAVHPKQLEANHTIIRLYNTLKRLPNSDMANRLDTISDQFLGKVYVLGALGEGSKARYDQEPRYRTDAFDCETYVATVLALALAKDKQGFKQCISKIRYKKGKISFVTRNHFISLDWNPNNQQQGFIKDITETIKKNKPVTKMATALIDKPSWYQHLTYKNIRLNPPNKPLQAKRLAELQLRGSKLPKQIAQIPYLPLTALFSPRGRANQFLFAQIPNGSIIEIVRPNWDLREQIGTNINVSHLGLAFWKKKVLYFRAASSKYGHVMDVPLIDYLREASSKPSIKGINIQVVLPPKPLSDDCTVA